MIHRPRFPAYRGSEAAAPGATPTSRAADRRAGFSLIELLTVIAIIAILAAMIFPIAGSVRLKAQESQVIANLNSIGSAIGIYKLDEHGYPATLGPVVTAVGGAIIQQGGLYPEYLKDKGAFQSPANTVQNPEALVQVDSAGSASAGAIAAPGSGPSTLTDPILRPTGGTPTMYAWDNMDGAVVGNSYAMHYSRYRTFNLTDPDYKRQLGFRNPPEDTVVTWNDSFVNYGLNPPRGDLLVLFLNGKVKRFSMADAMKATNGQFWRLTPS